MPAACENCGLAHDPDDTAACLEGHGDDPESGERQQGGSRESMGDILDVLALYLAAREHERRINTLFIDSIRPGRGTSQEVRQASSAALLAATQRTHELYRVLHLAATGVEAARYGAEQVDPDA